MIRFVADTDDPFRTRFYACWAGHWLRLPAFLGRRLAAFVMNGKRRNSNGGRRFALASSPLAVTRRKVRQGIKRHPHGKHVPAPIRVDSAATVD